MADFYSLEFDWDDDKAARNRRAHGVSFEEARSVFGDPLTRFYTDDVHSVGEDRYVAIGESEAGRLLMVVYSPYGTVVRLISARRPTRRELNHYERSSP